MRCFALFGTQQHATLPGGLQSSFSNLVLDNSENGYLIVRDAMDPDLMARARDRLWDFPPPTIKREDPSSWVGPLATEFVHENLDYQAREYHWHYHRVGKEAWIIDMLPRSPAIFAMAEQLLGAGEVVIPDHVRGIYCTLPRPVKTEVPDNCHTDGHPLHLGVVGYIDDVPPDGGGFRVWPGSHRDFYYAFKSQYVSERAENYAAVLERIRKGESVDCHGAAGDIIFWHHRLGHMAGHNFSDKIRQAILYDFCKRDLGSWFGKKRKQPTPPMLEPPCADMWRDWSEELRSIQC